MKSLLIFLFFFLSTFAVQATPHSNGLSLSQGISTPNRNHTTLYSKGFTKENPVGASYQNQFKATGSMDGSDSSGLGAEAGIGNGQYGMALGYYSNDCTGCESRLSGAVSAIWSDVGVGLGLQESSYTFGLLLNAQGQHRWGLVIETNNEHQGLERQSFGLGYSYVLPQFSFTLDASKQSFNSSTSYDDPVMITPGIAVRVEIVTVSIGYDLYIDDSRNLYENNVWFGIGINPTSHWQVSFYSEYVNRWMIQASYFF